jgi:PHD/YefM family antitoxin component YafN of YafNO toxin-antitoxin module
MDKLPSQSVEAFVSKPAETFQHLCKSGRPEALTVDGETRAIIMSPETYRALVERDDFYFAEVVHTEEDIAEMKASIAEADAGLTRPIDEAFDDIRRRLLERVAAKTAPAAK